MTTVKRPGEWPTYRGRSWQGLFLVGYIACWWLSWEGSQILALLPMFGCWIRAVWCLLNHRNKHPAVSSVRSPCWCPQLRAFSSVLEWDSQMSCAELGLQCHTAPGHICDSVAKHSPSLPDVSVEHTSHRFTGTFQNHMGKGTGARAWLPAPTTIVMT